MSAVTSQDVQCAVAEVSLPDGIDNGGVALLEMNLSTQINAQPQAVWVAITNNEKAQIWLDVFGGGGSQVSGDWEVGGELIFSDSEGHGVVCDVLEYEHNKHVDYQCTAVLIAGEKESKPIAESEGWIGVCESFSLEQNQDGVLLQVRTQCPESYRDYFTKKWPIAVRAIKQIAEADKIVS